MYEVSTIQAKHESLASNHATHAEIAIRATLLV